MFKNAKIEGASLSITFKIEKRIKFHKGAIDYGYYKFIKIDSSKKTHQSYGKFMTIIEPDSEGNWKFRSDVYNPTSEIFLKDLQ